MAKFKVSIGNESYQVEAPNEESLPEIVETINKQNVDTVRNDRIKEMAFGTAAVGAGGYGAYQVGRWATAPGRLNKPIRRELSQIQGKNPFLKGTDPSDMPQLLGRQVKMAERQNAYQMSNVKMQASIAKNSLKKQLQTFDDSVLTNTVEGLSNNIQQGYRPFLDSTYKSYRAGLNSVETTMSQQGVAFNSNEFVNNVITKTIDDAIREGIPEQQLNSLYAAKKSFETVPQVSKVLDKSGKPVTIAPVSKSMSVTQAKGVVNNVAKTLPKGAQHRIANNWGRYLENYAPPDVKPMIQDLNASYEPFTKLRTELNRVVDPKTGEFNIAKLNQYLMKYAKSKIESGQRKVLMTLSEGTKLSNPITGVAEQSAALQQARAQRAGIVNVGRDIELAKQVKVNRLAETVKKEIDDLVRWQARSEQLISQQSALKKKYPFRGPAVKGAAKTTGLRALGKFVRKGMTGLAIAPMALDAYKFAQDPEAYAFETKTGVPLAPPGTKQRWEQKWGEKGGI